MDLDSKKSRIIIAIVSSLVMALIFLVPYIKNLNGREKSQAVKAKYTRTGKDPNSNIEHTKSKMNKDYERDVKSYAFNEFLKNQVEKEPDFKQKEEKEDDFLEQTQILTTAVEIENKTKKSETAAVVKASPGSTTVKQEQKPINTAAVPEQPLITATVSEQPRRRVGFTGSETGENNVTPEKSDIQESNNIARCEF